MPRNLGAVRAALAGWYARPALVEISPLPLNPDEIEAGQWLATRGLAVLVSIDGKPYLQPATE